MTAPPVEAPVEPVRDDVCPHCQGVGWTDQDDYVPGVGYAATEARCDRCDGTGLAPVDADGYCACDDCRQLPTDQRFGGPQ